MPKLLDLFCGVGGAAVGYSKAGWEVVGVDIKVQPNYPFEFHLGNALEVDVRGFDAIHASPPCQAFSTITREQNKSKHPNLIVPTRQLLRRAGVPYVIENVPQAPLIAPIQLCGSSFGLRVRRHRLFEANVALEALPCDHSWQDADKRFRMHSGNPSVYHLSGVIGVYGWGTSAQENSQWPEAMGIDWTTNMSEIVEAIPPAYTEFIGRQLHAPIMLPVLVESYSAWLEQEIQRLGKRVRI